MSCLIFSLIMVIFGLSVNGQTDLGSKLETYRVKQDTYCLQDYGSFHSLDEAKASCDADPTCGKINDEECDGIHFKLCKKGITLESSSRGTCVYDKEDLTNSEECPTICNRMYLPVCGSDGVMYSNECMLQVAKCTVEGKQNLRKSDSFENCPDLRK